MSIKRNVEYTAICDVCGWDVSSEDGETKKDFINSLKKEEGWKITKKAVLCENCAKIKCPCVAVDQCIGDFVHCELNGICSHKCKIKDRAIK